MNELGSISVEEFAKAMKASGQSATAAEVQQIIDEVDRDGDGTIDFQGKSPPNHSTPLHRTDRLTNPEFVAMMTGQPLASKQAPASVSVAPEVDSEADYKAVWQEFDPSLKGSITASQFRQVMEALGESVTDGEVDEIINSVDGEDKISCEYIGFAALFCGSTGLGLS
jgi:Ca2+-binding EF-hand superfamily protein